MEKYKEYDEKYWRYALDVLDGKITACKYIKQACERYLSFFDKYDFKPTKCDRVINFISHIKHYNSSFAKKPFILMPWQEFVVFNIFGFYYPNSNKRVTSKVYIEVARKNGKTAFLMAIMLYLMIADNESGAECDIVANCAKQAGIGFEMAKKFVSSLDAKGKYFKKYRDKIKFEKQSAFFQVLASDASRLDGLNSYAFVLDECHEQKDSKIWDVMVSSQGMRENALGIITTTAGFNLFGFCYNYRSLCLEILAGVKENDRQFTVIYTLDEGDDYTDEKNWIKANPSLGVTVKSEYLQEHVLNAKNNKSLEHGVLTKQFNMWVSSADKWLPYDLLLESSKKINIEDFKDETCYVGVDLASVSDLTAVSAMWVKDDIYYFKTWCYIPEYTLYNSVNSELYKLWKRQGYLITTPGNTTDYDYITRDLMKLNEICPIEKIAYDSYNSSQWAIQCTELGLPLIPFQQSLWNFNSSTKEFERLIKNKQVVIDYNPITLWCFQNLELKFDHNDNCKPIKAGGLKSSESKIDNVIAMLEALGQYLKTPHYNNEI